MVFYHVLKNILCIRRRPDVWYTRRNRFAPRETQDLPQVAARLAYVRIGKKQTLAGPEIRTIVIRERLLCPTAPNWRVNLSSHGGPLTSFCFVFSTTNGRCIYIYCWSKPTFLWVLLPRITFQDPVSRRVCDVTFSSYPCLCNSHCTGCLGNHVHGTPRVYLWNSSQVTITRKQIYNFV